MSEKSTERRDLTSEQMRVGMERFFSPQNLDRYRKLAGKPLSSAERQEIFRTLAEEMRALRSQM